MKNIRLSEKKIIEFAFNKLFSSSAKIFENLFRAVKLVISETIPNNKFMPICQLLKETGAKVPETNLY